MPSPPGYLTSWKKFLNSQKQKGVPPNPQLHQGIQTCTHIATSTTNPFTHILTTHPAGTSSPTRPRPEPTPSPLDPLTHLSRPTFSHSQHTHTSVPGMLGHQPTSIVCAFSGWRGGRGPGWGSWRADGAGCGASGAQAWPGRGGGPGSARERRLIQPELVGRGCIYHPITVTNPGSTT